MKSLPSCCIHMVGGGERDAGEEERQCRGSSALGVRKGRQGK